MRIYNRIVKVIFSNLWHETSQQFKFTARKQKQPGPQCEAISRGNLGTAWQCDNLRWKCPHDKYVQKYHGYTFQDYCFAWLFLTKAPSLSKLLWPALFLLIFFANLIDIKRQLSDQLSVANHGNCKGFEQWLHRCPGFFDQLFLAVQNSSIGDLVTQWVSK